MLTNLFNTPRFYVRSAIVKKARKLLITESRLSYCQTCEPRYGKVYPRLDNGQWGMSYVCPTCSKRTAPWSDRRAAADEWNLFNRQGPAALPADPNHDLARQLDPKAYEPRLVIWCD